ncbi:MAG TPA: hypothetical protein VFF30_13700 [Nitrososphaerales archaeon]|nr:hypothetical protein [Nitrososphaerales archaeon]
MANSEFTSRKIIEVFSNAALKTLLEFGPSVRTAVLYHMEKMQRLLVEEILHDPVRFSKLLEMIFSAGATIIENKIIESMCVELSLDSDLVGRGSFEERLAKIRNLRARDSAPQMFYLRALEQTMR